MRWGQVKSHRLTPDTVAAIDLFFLFLVLNNSLRASTHDIDYILSDFLHIKVSLCCFHIVYMVYPFKTVCFWKHSHCVHWKETIWPMMPFTSGTVASPEFTQVMCDVTQGLVMPSFSVILYTPYWMTQENLFQHIYYVFHSISLTLRVIYSSKHQTVMDPVSCIESPFPLANNTWISWLTLLVSFS